jgi:transcriptional regulator with XRE-family HTH domain
LVLGASTPEVALAVTLRRMREERGATREVLAFRAGLTAGALAHIELAQAVPRWNTVRRIADALGVDMVELSAAVERAAAGSAPLRSVARSARPGTAEQNRARDDGGERHDP